MKYTFNLTIEYPQELKNESLSQEAVCNVLRNHTQENINSISKAIRDELFSRFPSLESKILNLDKFIEGIDEIAKNIFDAVNNAKVSNLDLNSIEIKVVVTDKDNKIQIRIKDNGPGFKNMEKSTQMPYLNYLATKNKSTKAMEKQQLNKIYLLGGYGIGLGKMLEEVKSLDDITIKNRKSHGADIRLTLNLQHDLNEPLDTESKIPKKFRKASNDVFFKDSTSESTMTTSDDEDSDKNLENWLDDETTLNKWFDEDSQSDDAEEIKGIIKSRKK